MEYYNMKVESNNLHTEPIEPTRERQQYIASPFTQMHSQIEITESENTTANSTITTEQLVEIVSRALSSLRVYVVESDITAAQSSVRAVVEQASF